MAKTTREGRESLASMFVFQPLEGRRRSWTLQMIWRHCDGGWVGYDIKEVRANRAGDCRMNAGRGFGDNQSLQTAVHNSM